MLIRYGTDVVNMDNVNTIIPVDEFGFYSIKFWFDQYYSLDFCFREEKNRDDYLLRILVSHEDKLRFLDLEDE